MGQLNLDSSMSELRYLASRTICSDSPLARIITGLIKMFPLLIKMFPGLIKMAVLLYLLEI